jgi:hypothetical protein
MATERQIEANRKNATRSTGPSPEARSRTRFNATKHGMAGELAEVEAARSPEFEDRRARWAADQNPVGEAGHWALDRAVAASLRIERCERAVDGLVAGAQQRARLAWDEDRAVEAATILGRLSRDPVLASRQLQTTFAGVGLLLEAWLGLLGALQGGSDWSESEVSRALDLLGVAADLRSGRTLVEAPEGTDPVAFRRELALEELERLEQLRDEAMAPLDESDRRRAATGDLALLSKPAKLVLRYERDAWRRYNQAMKELKAQAPPPAAVAPSPVVPSPTPAEARAPRSTEAERRKSATTAPIDPIDDDAWFDDLERRMGALPEAPERSQFVATERSQFVDFAIGRSA